MAFSSFSQQVALLVAIGVVVAILIMSGLYITYVDTAAAAQHMGMPPGGMKKPKSGVNALRVYVEQSLSLVSPLLMSSGAIVYLIT